MYIVFVSVEILSRTTNSKMFFNLDNQIIELFFSLSYFSLSYLLARLRELELLLALNFVSFFLFINSYCIIFGLIRCI